MKTVLITGASTGIGRAAAEHLAARGWRVFAGVRKEADGNALRAANEAIVPIILDVAKPDQIERAAQEIEQVLGGTTLNGLINNAGIAEMGPLGVQPLDTFRWHFDVNVFGLLAVTQAFLPLLGMDEGRRGLPGRIINITSVGGKIASPFLGAYTATKHAVESMTDSLRRELVVFGIDAIAIGPGSVKTPIWAKADEKAGTGPYDHTRWKDSIASFAKTMMEGGQTGLDPDAVSKMVETALTTRNPKARYAPVPNKLTNFTIASRLPKRMLDRIFWKRFGMQKPE